MIINKKKKIRKRKGFKKHYKITRITNKQYYILNYNNISLPTNILKIETQNVLITIVYRHKYKYTNEHVYFQVHIIHSI